MKSLLIFCLVIVVSNTLEIKDNQEVESDNQTCELKFYWDTARKDCLSCPAECEQCTLPQSCQKCTVSYKLINERCERESQILDICKDQACQAESKIDLVVEQKFNTLKIRPVFPGGENKTWSMDQFYKNLRIRAPKIWDLILGQVDQPTILRKYHDSDYYFESESSPKNVLEVTKETDHVSLSLLFSVNIDYDIELTLIGPDYSLVKNFTLHPFRCHSKYYYKHIDFYRELMEEDSKRGEQQRLFTLATFYSFSNIASFLSMFNHDFQVKQSVSQSFLLYLDQSLSLNNPANLKSVQPLLLVFYILIGLYCMTFTLRLIKSSLLAPLRFSSFILAYFAETFFNLFVPFLLLAALQDEATQKQYEDAQFQVKVIYGTLFALAVISIYGKDPIFFEYFVYDLDAYSNSYKQDFLKRYFHLASWVLKLASISYILIGDRYSVSVIVILRLIYIFILGVYKSLGSLIFKSIQSVQILVLIWILSKLESLDKEIDTYEKSIVPDSLINKFSLYDLFLHHHLLFLNLVTLFQTVFNLLMINEYFKTYENDDGFTIVKQHSSESLNSTVFNQQSIDKNAMISFEIEKPNQFEEEKDD